MSALISWLAGGSLSAAQWLTGGYGKRAINWGGGWHHAQRDKASGFCYVNDIVIAIHELRKKFDKVLYIDWMYTMEMESKTRLHLQKKSSPFQFTNTRLDFIQEVVPFKMLALERQSIIVLTFR